MILFERVKTPHVETWRYKMHPPAKHKALELNSSCSYPESTEDADLWLVTQCQDSADYYEPLPQVN